MINNISDAVASVCKWFDSYPMDQSLRRSSVLGVRHNLQYALQRKQYEKLLEELEMVFF